MHRIGIHWTCSAVNMFIHKPILFVYVYFFLHQLAVVSFIIVLHFFSLLNIGRTLIVPNGFCYSGMQSTWCTQRFYKLSISHVAGYVCERERKPVCIYEHFGVKFKTGIIKMLHINLLSYSMSLTSWKPNEYSLRKKTHTGFHYVKCLTSRT